MRWLLIIALAAAGLATYALIKKNRKPLPSTIARKANFKEVSNEWLIEHRRLDIFGASIEQYAKVHNYSTRYCFLADMKLPSGRNRLFVYDLKFDSIVCSGLVAHGSGTNFSDDIQFSNEPGSLCTSVGRYKIGASYMGKFGLAYKLYGLDPSNSNAYSRAVVLHAHSCVPDREVEPEEICLSWGCPTVSPNFLTRLRSYLDKTERPILLWVVN